MIQNYRCLKASISSFCSDISLQPSWLHIPFLFVLLCFSPSVHVFTKITSLYLILKFESTVTTCILRSRFIFPNYIHIKKVNNHTNKHTQKQLILIISILKDVLSAGIPVFNTVILDADLSLLLFRLIFTYIQLVTNRIASISAVFLHPFISITVNSFIS